MDEFVTRYLESLEREMRAPVGDISAHLLRPFDTVCTQGAFRYGARALAQRGQKVFFIAYETQQYGVGAWDGARGEVLDADQFLTPEAAVRSFLADEQAP